MAAFLLISILGKDKINFACFSTESMKFIEYSFNSVKIKFNKSMNIEYSSVSEVIIVILFCLMKLFPFCQYLLRNFEC